MNIAEIRKKARAGKTEVKRSVTNLMAEPLVSADHPATKGTHSPLPESFLPALNATLTSVQGSPLGEVVREKELLVAGEDRLDQLFSWVPQQDELLYAGSTRSSAEEKKLEVIARRWLAFSLGGEDYALDISVIREILKPREITEIPRVPDFLLGIISLRGNIVPIFDLKRRMGLGVATIDEDSRIIVCQDGERLAGLLIDRITQVTSIQEERIEPPPAIFSGRDRTLLDGVGRVEENVLILLNLPNVLTIDAIGL